MRRPARFTLSAIAFFALSACQTAVAPVQVTRFHTIAPATNYAALSFAIAAPPAGTLDEATYQEAVRREMQKIGYQSAGTGAAPNLLVQVTSSRDVLGAAARRSPVSVGVGGSTGSYGSGVGIGIGFNLGGRPKDVIVTRLSVSIRNAADNRPVWEGRAEAQARDGTPAAQPGLAAAKLAAALFSAYPGESGKTVIVP